MEKYIFTADASFIDNLILEVISRADQLELIRNACNTVKLHTHAVVRYTKTYLCIENHTIYV